MRPLSRGKESFRILESNRHLMLLNGICLSKVLEGAFSKHNAAQDSPERLPVHGVIEERDCHWLLCLHCISYLLDLALAGAYVCEREERLLEFVC